MENHNLAANNCLYHQSTGMFVKVISALECVYGNIEQSII